MGAPSPHALEPLVPREGMVVAGRWRLVARRGAGAMGSVWSARHVELGTAVAVKFLHDDFLPSEDARERFAREARVAAMLGERSRYIAKVSDYGVVDDVGPFLVMELLEGEELGVLLRRQRRLALPLVVQIVSQLCRALETAHENGIVHRDVKPANVFLAKPHTNMSVFVKLMDFGIAKILDVSSAHGGSALTRVGSVVGTPAYMSPEQMLAQSVDRRSDLWSVAATTYRMLTGELPFGNGTIAELGVRIVTGAPKLPTELVPELPRAVDEWMLKGLAKSAKDRFQSAREMADAFARAAGIDPRSLSPLAVVPTPLPEVEPPSGTRLITARPLPSVRRRSEPTTVEDSSRRALGHPVSGLHRVRGPRAIHLVLLLVAALCVARSTRVERPAPHGARFAFASAAAPSAVPSVTTSVVPATLPPDPSPGAKPKPFKRH